MLFFVVNNAALDTWSDESPVSLTMSSNAKVADFLAVSGEGQPHARSGRVH